MGKTARNREKQRISCILQRETIIFEGPNRKIFRLRRATGCRNSFLLVVPQTKTKRIFKAFYMTLYLVQESHLKVQSHIACATDHKRWKQLHSYRREMFGPRPPVDPRKISKRTDEGSNQCGCADGIHKYIEFTCGTACKWYRIDYQTIRFGDWVLYDGGVGGSFQILM